MANIIIHPWDETPGERSLRQLGHRTTSQGILETGLEFGGELLRKELIGDAMQRIIKALWELRQAMADQSWDDEKVLMIMGIQARNGWVKDVDGIWQESGSPEWIASQAKKAIRQK